MTYYIGVMTGTSLDGIDCVLCDFQDHKPKIIAHRQDPLGSELQRQLLALCNPGDNEIERLLVAEVALAETIADAVRHLLLQCSLSPQDIRAVGCHGQTIRHRPPSDSTSRGYTLQICDISTLAKGCGITCVGDFRRADMARHGQGAPMAPAFHAALLENTINCQAVLNIGGMANISLKKPGAGITGFDTGPGNVLLDTWIKQTHNKQFDDNGQWARQGQVIPKLLSQMLQHPFIEQATPKSTGRETFNANWLSQLITRLADSTPPEDIQRTLLEFSARSIVDAIADEQCADLFVCGGGAYNGFLMQRLSELLPKTNVTSSKALGINPMHMEAAAFAWFAKQALEKQSLALQEITGADQNAIAGLVHFIA